MFISGKNTVIELCPSEPDWIVPASCYYTFDQMAVNAKIGQKRGTTSIEVYGTSPQVIGGYNSFSIAGDVFVDLTVGRVTGGTLTAGSGYTSNPTIAVTSGGGSGCTAKAIINTAGAVVAVVITAWGTGYTSAPTFTFTGGAGTGAVFTPVINQYTDAVVATLMAASNILVRISTVGVGAASSKKPYYTGTIVPTQADIDPAVTSAIKVSLAGDGTGALTRTEY